MTLQNDAQIYQNARQLTPEPLKITSKIRPQIYQKYVFREHLQTSVFACIYSTLDMSAIPKIHDFLTLRPLKNRPLHQTIEKSVPGMLFINF